MQFRVFKEQQYLLLDQLLQFGENQTNFEAHNSFFRSEIAVSLTPAFLSSEAATVPARFKKCVWKCVCCMALLTGEGFWAGHKLHCSPLSPSQYTPYKQGICPTRRGSIRSLILEKKATVPFDWATSSPQSPFTTGKDWDKAVGFAEQAVAAGSMVEILSGDVYGCPANSWQRGFYSLSCGCFIGNSVSQTFWSWSWLTSHPITKVMVENATQAGWICRKAVRSFHIVFVAIE